MEEEKVYAFIKEIADDHFPRKEKITRADVASILKDKYRVDCADGAEMSRRVYAAYIHSGKPESIRWTVVSNNGGMSVVDQYELNARLDGDEALSALPIVEKDLGLSRDLLSEAKSSVEDVLKIELAKDVASLHKWLQGTSAIDEVREKSLSLMHNYGKMVDGYKAAENGVRTDIHDFVELRASVNSTFLQYANALVDVFGDSIKVVAPQLFDFDKVGYLDVSAMQKRTQLEFDKLDENCTVLLGEVASHFNQTVNQLPMWLKVNRSVGPRAGLYGSLVMGAVSYLNHWLDAQEKSVRVRNEYVKLEQGVMKDRQQMSGDLLRLAKIHKVMNDLYIPSASLFMRHADSVLSSDLKNLLDSVYQGDLLPLKKERDELLARCKDLERSINDHNENISLFDAQLVEMKGMLNSQKDNYDHAMERKPTEPGLMKRILTFGVAQREYGRRLLEWDEQDGLLVNAYQDTLMDVEEGSEDRNSHAAQLERDKKEYEACKTRVEDLNKQIAQRLNCSPQQKADVLKHLRNLLPLLHTGKAIVENKLDDSLLDVYVPSHVDEVLSLPDDVERNLHGFVSKVCSEIKDSGVEISRSVLRDFGLSEAEMTVELSQSALSAVEKTSELLKNWSYLQTQQMKSQLSEAVYKNEMERLKTDFRSAMSDIDQRSKILVEVMKRANTAADKDELRRALADLSGIPEAEMTEKDLEDILSGKKILKI